MQTQFKEASLVKPIKGYISFQEVYVIYCP